MLPRLPLLLAVLAVLLAAAPADAAQRRVPPGWLGVVADGPLGATDDAEWARIAADGAESVRFGIFWSDLQRSAGAPPDFAGTDAVVAAAARRGLALLPVVQRTPGWAALDGGASGPASPPAHPATFARFMSALVARYGPQGSLWAERPDLPRMPIRAWQIWNEPNLRGFWSLQPFARSYVRLLSAAERAVHAADPGATIVLAGLPNFSWTALRAIYKAGGRGHFDAVALHAYTRRPADVLRLVRLARAEMRKYGDGRMPVWLTEVSWPAAQGKVPRPANFDTTDRGQARRLDAALRLLVDARRRERIGRVFWYTWLSAERGRNSFAWSGLRRLRRGVLVSTPALTVFRRWAHRLEGR